MRKVEIDWMFRGGAAALFPKVTPLCLASSLPLTHSIFLCLSISHSRTHTHKHTHTHTHTHTWMQSHYLSTEWLYTSVFISGRHGAISSASSLRRSEQTLSCRTMLACCLRILELAVERYACFLICLQLVRGGPMMQELHRCERGAERLRRSAPSKPPISHFNPRHPHGAAGSQLLAAGPDHSFRLSILHPCHELTCVPPLSLSLPVTCSCVIRPVRPRRFTSCFMLSGVGWAELELQRSGNRRQGETSGTPKPSPAY